MNRNHRVEAKQLEIGEIVARERLAAQMRHDTAQPAKAARTPAHTLEVRQLDAERIAHRDVFDRTVPGDQRADLPTRLARNLGELARELLRNQPVARNPALIEVAELAQLTGLEAVCLTV